MALLPCALVVAPAKAQNSTNSADENTGAVRLARFSYLKGDVSWRGAGDSDWTSGAMNMPLREGAQISTANGGQAELQFDDGSRIRLDGNSLVTLQTLYSDKDGEFTEITLNSGKLGMRLNNKYSLYQVNTSESSLKASGPARIRVSNVNGSQFLVKKGTAVVEGQGGQATLNPGNSLRLANANSPYNVQGLPSGDNWDRWNDTRDQNLDGYTAASTQHLPSNIGLVGDDLSSYGSWQNDPNYGYVWEPRVSDSNWRPYSSGRWTYVEPFGWTWVGNEPWGWAPYHYGTWVHRPHGWGWSPGPRSQYWSPAVVSYSYNNGSVAWVPLAPREVRYPSTLSIGFGGGDWSAFFSIGGAGVYYPTGGNYLSARPWSSRYINRYNYYNRGGNNVRIVNNYNQTFITNRNTFVNNRFIPANARFQGGSQVAVNRFGTASSYGVVGRNQVNVFKTGRAIGAPANNGRFVAGPQNVKVTRSSFSPSRTFRPSTAAQRQIVRQPVFRAAAPRAIPTTPAIHGQRFSNVTRPAVAGRTPVAPRTAIRPGTAVPNAGRVNPRTSGAVGAPGRPINRTTPAVRTPANRGTVGARPGVNGANPARPNVKAGSGLDHYLKDRAAKRIPTANGNRSALPAASRNAANRTANPATKRTTPGRSTAPSNNRTAPGRSVTPSNNRSIPNRTARPSVPSNNRTARPATPNRTVRPSTNPRTPVRSANPRTNRSTTPTRTVTPRSAPRQNFSRPVTPHTPQTAPRNVRPQAPPSRPSGSFGSQRGFGGNNGGGGGGMRSAPRGGGGGGGGGGRPSAPSRPSGGRPAPNPGRSAPPSSPVGGREHRPR